MKEQNEELLQAAETLLGIIDDCPEFLTLGGAHKAKEAREIIESHRPKPKRLEGWINFYDDSRPGGAIWPTEQDAKDYCINEPARQVHIREVVPFEWEPWTVEMVRNQHRRNFQATVDAHNAEMERVTK